MNIRVTSDDKLVSELKYDHVYPQGQEEGNQDLEKLMTLQREMAMRPVEKELKQLSKENQYLKKLIGQLGDICEGEGTPEQKISSMKTILNNG